MGWRNDQCRKVCRIIDNCLANRPTERDSLIVAVQKAFDALEQPETNCSEIPNNSDTISRQAAIDALDKRFGSIPMEQTTEILLLRKDLRNLPAAQPQRKTGEWVLQSDDYHEYYECDQCGIAVGLDDVRNFCPNCGAKMKGAKHETD